MSAAAPAPDNQIIAEALVEARIRSSPFEVNDIAVITQFHAGSLSEAFIDARKFVADGLKDGRFVAFHDCMSNKTMFRRTGRLLRFWRRGS
jgi:hypothetical protein